jgi:hypothetical protein
MRNTLGIFMGQPEQDQYEDHNMCRKIIIKWNSRREYGVVWTGLIWLQIGSTVSLLKILQVFITF